MHVVVGGASGFLGTALVAHLRDEGHQVTRLVRSGTPGPDASVWDPAAGRIDQVLIDRADAVVNLSGATIARWPRTESYKKTLWSSRVDSTTTLTKAVAASSTPTVLLSGSAMGIYGADRGDERLTESASRGDGFLADLCVAWEGATAPAEQAGQRVVHLRTGLPLDDEGGLLGPMLLPFKLGLGPRLGKGRQRMSVMSRRDWVRAVAFLLERDDVRGPVNLSLPEAPTNAEFTRALGQVLGRPTVLVAPAPILRTALGALSDDLLGSLRMVPEVLLDAGFVFEDPDLPTALRSALD
jgi:uncharacterized protein (TIGR01777 family)